MPKKKKNPLDFTVSINITFQSQHFF